MAWSAYTSALTSGGEFTSAQYAELLSALDERLKAVDATWGISTGASQTAIIASGLVTAKVVITGAGLGTDATTTLHGAITALSTYYLRPLFIEAGTGTSGAYSGNAVLVDALTAMGAASLVPSDWINATISTPTYWNMLRDAVLLLRWVPLTLPSVSARYSKAITSTDVAASGLAAAVAGYASASETLAGGSQLAMVRINASRYTGATYDPFYLIDGFRADTTGGASIPSSSIWSAWRPAYRPTWALPSSTTEYANQDAEILIDGTAYEVSGSASTGQAGWEVASSNSTASGSASIGYRMKGYSDGSELTTLDGLLAWVPSGTAEFKSGGTSLTVMSLAGRPTFDFT